jgi:hypothetical protein
MRCSNSEFVLQVNVADLVSGMEAETVLRCFCGCRMKKF